MLISTHAQSFQNMSFLISFKYNLYKRFAFQTMIKSHKRILRNFKMLLMIVAPNYSNPSLKTISFFFISLDIPQFWSKIKFNQHGEGTTNKALSQRSFEFNYLPRCLLCSRRTSPAINDESSIVFVLLSESQDVSPWGFKWVLWPEQLCWTGAICVRGLLTFLGRSNLKLQALNYRSVRVIVLILESTLTEEQTG